MLDTKRKYEIIRSSLKKPTPKPDAKKAGRCRLLLPSKEVCVGVITWSAGQFEQILKFSVGPLKFTIKLKHLGSKYVRKRC